ncbi:unnamed protein product [Moneuplotes crassus]|uniref:Uncharacterized protein n=1 Tax=Euplotes crassus TaxID=5936 RepID=A0AAD1U3T1_EUPCR|nr:unnamed protein product [Moneuplotes crassus]
MEEMLRCRETPVVKVNDHGKCENRKIRFDQDFLVVIKGKSSEKRKVYYEDITGVSYTSNLNNPEFVIHNEIGDLRFKCEYNEINPDEDLLIKLRYLQEFLHNWDPDYNIPFFCVEMEDLKLYHNTKKDYKKSKSLNFPSVTWMICADDLESRSDLPKPNFEIPHFKAYNTSFSSEEDSLDDQETCSRSKKSLGERRG